MRISERPPFGWQLPDSAALPLVLGDFAAFLIFVVIGRLSHGASGDWVANMVRIATPFLAAWLLAGSVTGALRWQDVAIPLFALRTFIALVVANGLAFAFRYFLFQDNVTVPFALTSLAFTTLFVGLWRLLFLLCIDRTRTR